MAAAVLALAGCDDRVAGTSVGTGNPTEIQVGFRDSSGAPVAMTGTLKVYASTQIPVEGFAPDPLLSMQVEGATSATLKAEAFQALADSLWPKESVEGGTRKFNLVLIGSNKGFVLSGFGVGKAADGFSPRAGDDIAAWSGTKANVTAVLSPLDSLSGSVDTTTFTAKWDYHLFVYGTGFASKIVKGRYSLAGVPRGRYQGDIILLPSSSASRPLSDSTQIFDLNGVIGGSQGPLSLGPVRAIVPLPDSLVH
jgi:hypothetical protein